MPSKRSTGVIGTQRAIRATTSIVLVVVVLAAAGCGPPWKSGPPESIPSTWKTFRGDGWSMRYPPSYTAWKFSPCAITLLGEPDHTQINPQPCDAYPNTHVGLGRVEVAFLLVNPSQVPASIRAREVAPPLRLRMVRIGKEDATIWDGMSNIPIPYFYDGFKDVRIHGRDYQLIVSFSQQASDQDRETVDQILSSIHQTALAPGGGSFPSPTPSPPSLGPVPPPAQSGGGDAPDYQVDVAHDGEALNPVPLPLTQTWSRSLGGKVSFPLIVGGSVYVIVTTLKGTALSYQTMALDLRTGRTLWSHAESASVRPIGLAYDSGGVFYADGAGLVKRYDAASGVPSWQSHLALFEYSDDGPPTAWGGRVYVSGSGNLYALDEQTGRTLWTQQVNGDYSPPTLMGSRIFVAYIGHQFDAFSAYDGKLLWNPPGTGMGGGGDTVAAYRGRIYAHEDGQTVILDARKGRVVGRLPCGTIPAFRG
ncbi:MAG TPA: PQQ-binding-like beta-propeller repeat protein, partial [Actinomycetota bacterium]|nr:PQQ-binding-like beta-propeller repeat protein [Actinomycetota bacterium]